LLSASSSLDIINSSVDLIIGRLTKLIAISSQNLISIILLNFYKWCLNIIIDGHSKYYDVLFISILVNGATITYINDTSASYDIDIHSNSSIECLFSLNLFDIYASSSSCDY